MEIPATLAAEQAIAQQRVAMGVMKQSADAEKAMANVLAQAVDNVSTGGRGGAVNITA